MNYSVKLTHKYTLENRYLTVDAESPPDAEILADMQAGALGWPVEFGIMDIRPASDTPFVPPMTSRKDMFDGYGEGDGLPSDIHADVRDFSPDFPPDADGIVRPYRAELLPYARSIADKALASINDTVPLRVAGMPYARQWVLEEMIKMLEGAV